VFEDPELFEEFCGEEVGGWGSEEVGDEVVEG